MKHTRLLLAAAICALLSIATGANSVPTRAQKGMVASQNTIASRIGADVISAGGTPVTYDFREKAPVKASPTMWMKDGKYDNELHHSSHLAVGVPGTVAGLHLAWKEQGKLPWKRLVDPAIALARDGFPVTEALARSLKNVMT